MQLATVAEYAKLRGCSRQAVEKASAKGCIVLIDTPEGRRVDVDQANIDWAAKTDAAQQLRGAPIQTEQTQRLARGARARIGDAKAREKPPSKSSSHGLGRSLIEEKTRGERLKVRRQEIELAQLEGLLISRQAVEAALSTKLIAFAETLQVIPDRFSALFAAETDTEAIHRVLVIEIRAALTMFATPRF